MKITWSPPVLKVVKVKDLTRNGSGSGTDGGLDSAMMMMSDSRIKRNIAFHRACDCGTALYSFSYLHDDARRIGVLAQEIERTRPDAVAVTSFGLLAVDYARLGLAWVLSHQSDGAQETSPVGKGG